MYVERAQVLTQAIHKTALLDSDCTLRPEIFRMYQTDRHRMCADGAAGI
jgi:hypothetical protein